MWCCVTPERRKKTLRIMEALAAGCGGRVCVGPPPDDGPFAVWGHKWLSERIVPKAHAQGRPWWFVDNGYHLPARGGPEGYYALTFCGIAPVLLDDAPRDRLRIRMAPWRRNHDGPVLLALPGRDYGRMLGLDMESWNERIRKTIGRHTDRRVIIRDKASLRPLAEDLAECSVVVTHSSKVAVDAVIAGVPAIVEPSNPAAPVCSTRLEDIETPLMPSRAKWWASLMAQQFTLDEMRRGFAAEAMQAIRDQRGGENTDAA